MLDKMKPAAIGARRASASVFVNWHADGAEDNPSQASEQIRAELIGSDSCKAIGIAAQSSSPVLALCRRLVAAGVDPATPMEVYRGATLALWIRSIGEAARLEVNAKGSGFIAARAVRPAPPMRQNECPAILQIVATAPANELRPAIEAYLRDELHDVVRAVVDDVFSNPNDDDRPTVLELNAIRKEKAR
jgi:hypothetical protein